MTSPIDERRNGSRVSLRGNMHWHSGRQVGEGHIVDISPQGASFETLDGQAPQLGQIVSLHVNLDDQVEWRISDGAKVVRRNRPDNDACQIAVAFIKPDS